MAGLRDLGLSAYEVDVYRTLLERGESTAKTLAREADVPLGRVYEIIDALEEKRVVRVQHDTHPKKVTAVEPDVAIDRLVEQCRQQVEAELDRFERAAEAVREEFDRTGVVTGEEFVTTAIGGEEALELLLERYDSASRDLLLAFREPPAASENDDNVATVVETLEQAVERGVTVRILLAEGALAEVPAAQQTHMTEFLAENDVDLRISPSLDQTVAVVDDVELCLEERTPTSKELFALVNVRDARFARQYRKEMLKLWEAGQPTAPP